MVQIVFSFPNAFSRCNKDIIKFWCNHRIKHWAQHAKPSRSEESQRVKNSTMRLSPSYCDNRHFISNNQDYWLRDITDKRSRCRPLIDWMYDMKRIDNKWMQLTQHLEAYEGGLWPAVDERSCMMIINLLSKLHQHQRAFSACLADSPKNL